MLFFSANISCSVLSVTVNQLFEIFHIGLAWLVFQHVNVADVDADGRFGQGPVRSCNTQLVCFGQVQIAGTLYCSQVQIA